MISSEEGQTSNYLLLVTNSFVNIDLRGWLSEEDPHLRVLTYTENWCFQYLLRVHTFSELRRYGITPTV